MSASKERKRREALLKFIAMELSYKLGEPINFDFFQINKQNREINKHYSMGDEGPDLGLLQMDLTFLMGEKLIYADVATTKNNYGEYVTFPAGYYSIFLNKRALEHLEEIEKNYIKKLHDHSPANFWTVILALASLIISIIALCRAG